MENNLAQRKKQSYKIFDEIAHRYDFLNRILSFGIDVYWRNKLTKKLPRYLARSRTDLRVSRRNVHGSSRRNPPLLLRKLPVRGTLGSLTSSDEYRTAQARLIQKA